MHYYYITGTSTGIGHALAKHLLEQPDSMVIGISRRQTIQHRAYRHIQVDLSMPGDLDKIDFSETQDADRIALINNAATLGEVTYAGRQSDGRTQDLFQINLLSPIILTNRFIERFAETPAEKIVLNVSSGAGKKNIDGWSNYCASKAGLDRWSEVVALEQSIKGLAHPVRIFSIAPGIVDTPMQDQIREQKKRDFSRVEEFIAYKKEGHLVDPAYIAGQYARILNDPQNYTSVVFSLRDIRK